MMPVATQDTFVTLTSVDHMAIGKELAVSSLL